MSLPQSSSESILPVQSADANEPFCHCAILTSVFAVVLSQASDTELTSCFSVRSFEKFMFLVEQAHWFYEVRPALSLLHSKKFAMSCTTSEHFHCPFLAGLLQGEEPCLAVALPQGVYRPHVWPLPGLGSFPAYA